MFPVFKLKFVLGKGEETKAVIECGDRSIEIRGATGEVGPEGRFPYVTLTERSPYVTLTEKGEEKKFTESGFCLHSETIFNEFWDQLKDLAEK
ncbi:unnamed protein product [marine sediment metagenome]|uniref:Uncharacterized protein n=1 Tax=marine sediment metagenome TaxID=412755 RepID=X1FX17_9ZZZZ